MMKTEIPGLTFYGRQTIGTLGDVGRWGMLILPGGGYHCLAPAEGEPTALAFAGRGVQTFVYEYPVDPEANWPENFLRVCEVMQYLHKNARKYGFSKKKLAICGFSAGGHLAGCVVNLFAHTFVRERGLEPALVRPDAGVLCYPVITGDQEFWHNGSFDHLLGAEKLRKEGKTPVLPKELSLESSIPADAPPVFLWCTGEDDTVPPENSLLYANSLRKTGIPFEFHYFQRGPHAMGVATEDSAFEEMYANSHAANWVGLCADWLKKTGKNRGLTPDRPGVNRGAAPEQNAARPGLTGGEPGAEPGPRGTER